MNMRSSKALLGKMRSMVELMEKDLLQNNLSAETQIADIAGGCCSLVELAFRLQEAAGEELSDLE